MSLWALGDLLVLVEDLINWLQDGSQLTTEQVSILIRKR